MMNLIPKLSLEKLKLSRMVCGTNQFMGITHRANPLDMLWHQIRFRKSETVARYFIYLLQNHGVNCCISSPRDKIFEAIQIAEKETGERFYWICTPSTRMTAKKMPLDIWKQIDWCVEHQVVVCMPHRDYTDNALNKSTLTIGGKSKDEPPYETIATYIRDKGMIPGLSTHYVESIDAVEKNHYDAKLIVQPLNKIGFESDTTPEILTKRIQTTKLTILNIKPMAAGRLTPQEAIPWCLERIKSTDFLAVGHGYFKYCVENAQLVEKLMNR
jgi:hypothetical protein